MKAFSVEDLTVQYGATVALENICLDGDHGEILAILGPSGSGKTTLLGAIAGFIDVTAGQIWIGETLAARRGFSLPTERRGVGVVFQNYGLWPHLNAMDTVAYPLRRQGVNRARARQRAEELLAQVGLAGLGQRLPSMLSGGQQQRVGLARALACRPRLFLFDEPTANLDSELRAGLQVQIREQQQRTGAAAVYVTHDPLEAFAVADRVAVVRNARLVQVAPPREIYTSPADEWVARLTGPCSIVEAHVLDDETVRISDALVRGVSVGNACGGSLMVKIAIRPEWIRVSGPEEYPLVATVRAVTFAGAQAICSLDTTVGVVVTHVPGEAGLHPGDTVSWTLTAAQVLEGSSRQVVAS